MSVVPEVPVDNPGLTKGDLNPPAEAPDASEPPGSQAKDLIEKDVGAEKSKVKLEGLDDDERLEVIQQVEFYFSDANLPFDKFMFLQTSPHLDSVKAPNLSAEAKQKAEAYGPGCSPVLLQTVASFKRMRRFSSKFPTSKLAEILQTSPTSPKLIEIMTEELNGQPTLYIRRVLKLEESNRAGASDHCVYAKGFLSEEELEKGEPKDIQVRLEKWAKQWGQIGVLRMRRENNDKREAPSKDKREKKWKNSVFIEFRDPSSAERLVNEFKLESGKPQFDGRELSSIMFKMDYVTMKAKEKGLPVPKMNKKHQPGNLTGSAGGNSTSFNAFRELAAIEAGKKQYAGVPISSKAGEQAANEVREIEYEGNQLQVNKDGTLKNPEELKNFRPNLALGFELKGDAPSNHREARVDFHALKKDLSEGELVCNVVHLTPNNPAKGTVGFDRPINDEQYTQIQSKGIKSGGRTVTFTRLGDDDYKQFHLDCAIFRAKSMFGSKDKDTKPNKRGNDARRGGRRGDRDNGRRGQNGTRGGDRNAEISKEQKTQGQTGEETPSNPSNVVGTKRDAEGNVISTNGGTVNPASTNSIPEIGRAEKKIKTAP